MPEEVDDNSLPAEEVVDDAAESADESEGDSSEDPAESGTESGDTSVADQGAKTSAERRKDRIQELSRRAKEAEDRALRAETLAEERAKVRPAADTGDAYRIEQEKLSLMDPQEKREYLRDKELRELKNGMAITQFQMRDIADKAQFEAKANASPTAKKLAGDVEKMFQDALSKGNFVPRISLYRYILGQRADEQADKPASKQTQQAKKQAAARVDSVKGTSVSARSDAGGKKAGGEETLEQMRARIIAREERGETY